METIQHKMGGLCVYVWNGISKIVSLVFKQINLKENPKSKWNNAFAVTMFGRVGCYDAITHVLGHSTLPMH